jgi:CRP-like cAMP-binding protein
MRDFGDVPTLAGGVRTNGWSYARVGRVNLESFGCRWVTAKVVPRAGSQISKWIWLPPSQRSLYLCVLRYRPVVSALRILGAIQSIVSLVAKVTGNATLEVALVGHKGMVGLPLLVGADTEPLLALVQRSGEAWRMQAEPFKRLMHKYTPLRRALIEYAFLRLSQLAQNAACARTHALAARSARSLLTMEDRSPSRYFYSTQDGLASMLGVRRTTVSLLAFSLQQKNIIQYRRGTLTILDRKALETLSCECYWRAPDRCSPSSPWDLPPQCDDARI